MSEQRHKPTGNLVKPIEAVGNEELHLRGVRLVSESVLPQMANLPLTMDPNSLPSEHRFASTAILYSERKNISASVILYLTLDEEPVDSLPDDTLGTLMKSGAIGGAALQTNVNFVRGKFTPNAGGYGAYDYFGDALYEESLGKFEATVATTGSSEIHAQLGTGGYDDELNIGTIDTFAAWLKDAEVLA